MLTPMRRIAAPNSLPATGARCRCTSVTDSGPSYSNNVIRIVEKLDSGEVVIASTVPLFSSRPSFPAVPVPTGAAFCARFFRCAIGRRTRTFTACGGQRIVDPMTDPTARPELICTTCGKSFRASAGNASDSPAALVEEESARCSRLLEIAQQRQTLAARMQAGIAGVVGSETLDTVDMVAQRQSLAQLDATLKAEAEELSKVMRHVPGEP